jgi:hypothetical protein|tara:strand:+ start:466 stop:750 length:285 start_codon:yes stop_codon:yes gene_type:complete
LIANTKQFFIKSYRADPIAFYFEVLSFVFTVAASLVLAINAANPNMLIVYPGFFVGSVSAIVAYMRRGIAIPMILTTYFAVTNIYGFGRASYWW